MAGLRAAAEERARRAELDAGRGRAEAEAAGSSGSGGGCSWPWPAAVGLLAAGGGAFAWWQDKQATARRAEAENRDRDERERLARNADALADLVGRCEEALRADDADRAAAALDQVDRRLPRAAARRWRTGSPGAGPTWRMLRELDAVDTFRWTLADGARPSPRRRSSRPGGGRRSPGTGSCPGDGPAGEAAGRVAGSLVRDRLLAALDLWLVA